MRGSVGKGGMLERGQDYCASIRKVEGSRGKGGMLERGQYYDRSRCADLFLEEVDHCMMVALLAACASTDRSIKLYYISDSLRLDHFHRLIYNVLDNESIFEHKRLLIGLKVIRNI